MFDTQTLNHIVNLSNIIQNSFDDLYQRALWFGSVILGVYSIEFAYIYIQLIVRKLTVDDIAGGTVFIAYSFFNFFVMLLMVI
jgi:hypothetical protein